MSENLRLSIDFFPPYKCVINFERSKNNYRKLYRLLSTIANNKRKLILLPKHSGLTQQQRDAINDLMQNYKVKVIFFSPQKYNYLLRECKTHDAVASGEKNRIRITNQSFFLRENVGFFLEGSTNQNLREIMLKSTDLDTRDFL